MTESVSNQCPLYAIIKNGLQNIKRGRSDVKNEHRSDRPISVNIESDHDIYYFSKSINWIWESFQPNGFRDAWMLIRWASDWECHTKSGRNVDLSSLPRIYWAIRRVNTYCLSMSKKICAKSTGMVFTFVFGDKRELILVANLRGYHGSILYKSQLWKSAAENLPKVFLFFSKQVVVCDEKL